MADSGIEFLVKKSEGQWHIQGDMSVIKKYDLHHTVIPPWIYRIPSELRSQAGLGLPSTVVGDHTGIVSAVCFLSSTKNHGGLRNMTLSKEFLTKKVVKNSLLKNHGGLRN